jgi:hypothetical protein
MNTGITNVRGWQNDQESQIYPLLRAYDVPRALLTDLSIAAEDENIFIDTLYCGDGQVSLILSDSSGVAAALTVENPVRGEVYTVVDTRCMFSVSFGQAAIEGTYRNKEKLFVSPQCIHVTVRSNFAVFRQGGLPLNSPLKLTGSNDISVRLGFMDEAQTEQALFLSLNTQDAGIDVHDKYLGSCDRRPVSQNCEGNQPIKTLSGVPSDCCNTIYIELQGVSIAPLNNYCGIAIESEFTLKESCPARTLTSIVERSEEDCEKTDEDESDDVEQDGAPEGEEPLTS